MGPEPIGGVLHRHSLPVGRGFTSFYRSHTPPPLNWWEHRPGEAKVTHFEPKSLILRFRAMSQAHHSMSDPCTLPRDPPAPVLSPSFPCTFCLDLQGCPNQGKECGIECHCPI